MYRRDWATFAAWCEGIGLQALPACPTTVGRYVAHLGGIGRKYATVARAMVAISQAHKMAGCDPSPTGSALVLESMKGLAAEISRAQDQKTPVLVEDLRRMLEAQPDTVLGTRDRAMLCVGFAGAFRRSELVALDVADLTFGRDGLTINIRRSKTDQEGLGREVGLPYGGNPTTCPVRTLQTWLDLASINAGPVFRGVTRGDTVVGERLSDQGVARAVKRACEAVGLDPAKYAGHSLRSGLATSAARAGKSERAIMDQTGHRSVATVRRYIRRGSIFNDNAAGGIGL